MTTNETTESLTYALVGSTSTRHIVKADDPTRVYCGRRFERITTKTYGPVCVSCASKL